jgi:hypothetical protein
MSVTSTNPLAGFSTPHRHSLNLINRLSTLVVLGFILSASPVQADEPDDQYLRIFNLIVQADSASTAGQTGPALAKYREAQAALENFKKTNPDWNTRAVSYRMKYVAGKVVALSGASAEPASTAVTSTSNEAPVRPKGAASASVAEVKLLEAGAEPRSVLRLHPKAGDKQTFSMIMKMAMAMKLAGMENPPMKMPAITMTADLTVNSVSEDGDISYGIIMGDSSVSDDPSATPQIAEALKTSLAGLKGLSAAGIMSSRGIVKSIEVKSPSTTDPQAAQMIDQMKEAMVGAALPLPEEAVGAGAKWQHKRAVKTQGMTIDQIITYQLASVEDQRVIAKVAISQRAANQQIQNPAMPGLKLDLTKMTGDGTGDLKANLAQIVPFESTADSHAEMAMGMNLGGQKQEMTMKLDVNMRLEAK